MLGNPGPPGPAPPRRLAAQVTFKTLGFIPGKVRQEGEIKAIDNNTFQVGGEQPRTGTLWRGERANRVSTRPPVVGQLPGRRRLPPPTCPWHCAAASPALADHLPRARRQGHGRPPPAHHPDCLPGRPHPVRACHSGSSPAAPGLETTGMSEGKRERQPCHGVTATRPAMTALLRAHLRTPPPIPTHPPTHPPHWCRLLQRRPRHPV